MENINIPSSSILTYNISNGLYYIHYIQAFYDMPDIIFKHVASITESIYKSMSNKGDIINTIKDEIGKYKKLTINIVTNNIGNYLNLIAQELYIQSFALMHISDLEKNKEYYKNILLKDLRDINSELTDKFLNFNRDI